MLYDIIFYWLTLLLSLVANNIIPNVHALDTQCTIELHHDWTIAIIIIIIIIINIIVTNIIVIIIIII